MTGSCDTQGDCVSSLNYPSAHGNNEACSVSILQDVSITVGSTWDLETCCDHLYILGRDVEQPEQVPLALSAGDEFEWSTDVSVTRAGWQLCFGPPLANCGGSPHGTTESRTMYSASSVNAPDTCVSETQTRTCDNGNWGTWSGTFLNAECIVYAQCGTATHSSSETRTYYYSSSVNAPASCSEETQTRTCDNGNWGVWSGTYTHSSCLVFSQCGSATHGSTESRTRYDTSSVNAPATCNEELQSRICNDGNWGSWSGNLNEIPPNIFSSK